MVRFCIHIIPTSYVTKDICTAPSSAPTLLSSSVIDSQTIELFWAPPQSVDHNGIIREYNVNILEVETDIEFYHVISSTFIVVSSLHPDYMYEWSVAAVTVSTGPYSYTLNITTPENGKCGPDFA